VTAGDRKWEPPASSVGKMAVYGGEQEEAAVRSFLNIFGKTDWRFKKLTRDPALHRVDEG
jgi:hypothetical protein